MALTPGTRVGPYDVVSQIGAGGMGEVYRATDSNLKRSVALKVLPTALAADTERLARFQREAEVLASLNHPNIAAIYGVERSDGVTALVMEFVGGSDLSALIPLSKPDALAIARQLADALEAAHERGIVHRDLKPANIKVRPDGTVKVLDFGLAKAIDPTDATSSATGTNPFAATMTSPAMTQMGAILGTAAYMAPEQAKGRPVDRRADIWAFGAVLYEMLTGQRAFSGENVTEVLASVLAGEPDWSRLPSDEPVLGACVRRCLQRDPRQRFGDMQSVRLALDGAFSAPAVGATAVSPTAATPVPTSRRAESSTRWWMVSTAALLVSTIALSAGYLHRADPDPRVIRSTILQPDGTVFDFDATVGPVVISPDGRQLAFSARSKDGRIQLWVRALETAEAHAIDGTDGASFPFWSPDSRSLGFYNAARGRIERVAIAGGAPVPVVSAAFVRGASWGTKDTIVFDSAGPSADISVVPAGSGTATPVVRTGSPRSPWMLPDGDHFLYLDRRANEIRLGSTDGAPTVRVGVGASNAIFASGHLLFIRDGVLMAQAFDPSSHVLSGPPRAVAPHVQMLLGGPAAFLTRPPTARSSTRKVAPKPRAWPCLTRAVHASRPSPTWAMRAASRPHRTDGTHSFGSLTPRGSPIIGLSSSPTAHARV
jgi:serine/threonine protein kinase